MCALVDQHGARLRQAFEAGCSVHDIADDPFPIGGRGIELDDRFAGRDCDPYRHLELGIRIVERSH